MLALLLHNGLGVAQDEMRALVLFHKACDGGAMIACAYLGAVNRMARACRKTMCRRLATIAGPAKAATRRAVPRLICLSNGFGVMRDAVQAFALYRKACDGGQLAGCHKVAVAYQGGGGHAADPDQSGSYSEDRCTGGRCGRACQGAEGGTMR